MSDNVIMASKPKKSRKPARTRVTVQVPGELRLRMERAAAADNRSLSNWIVDALSRALAKETK